MTLFCTNLSVSMPDSPFQELVLGGDAFYIFLPGDSGISGFFRVCFILLSMKKAREIDSHELEMNTEK